MKSQNQEQDRLDEKSLDLLSRLDHTIEDHYDRLSAETSTEEESGFSLDYEKKKESILEGEIGTTVQKSSHEDRRRVYYRRMVALIILVISLVAIIGPQKIYATVNRFGKAILQVFSDHTDFYYKDIREKGGNNPGNIQKIYLESYLPEGYKIIGKSEEKYSFYCHSENSEDQWIDLDISAIVENSAVGLDTENAVHHLLEIGGISINQYVKPKLTIYYWEYADQIYTLAGNAFDDVEMVFNKIIHEIAEKR